MEKKIGNFKIFFQIFFRFFFPIFFQFFFLSHQIFWPKGSSEGEQSERQGVVGERSEPSAGGLAVGAEGSVNSEFY